MSYVHDWKTTYPAGNVEEEQGFSALALLTFRPDNSLQWEDVHASLVPPH